MPLLLAPLSAAKCNIEPNEPKTRPENASNKQHVLLFAHLSMFAQAKAYLSAGKKDDNTLCDENNRVIE